MESSPIPSQTINNEQNDEHTQDGSNLIDETSPLKEVTSEQEAETAIKPNGEVSSSNDVIDKAPSEKDVHEDVVDDDGFVVIELDKLEKDFRFEANRVSFFQQIESHLVKQVEKCDYFKNLFEKQNNATMANKFAAYSVSSTKNLEILRASLKDGLQLPKYKFNLLSFNSVPTNVDVKDKELQIVVKTSQLDKNNPTAEYYVIAEFFFPRPGASSFSESVQRWLHYAKIEPKNIIPCIGEESKQLDIIYSTLTVPFTDPDSKSKEFDRPISFFIDKGRSRTLKRKFKPIKLTFYEKTGAFKLDKKIGSVQVRIDSVNDDATVVSRLPILNNRKPINAMADIKVRVREPLVDKTIRNCEEKMLVLS